MSENGHFLVRADGVPFFYLGDMAWELIHRLTREDAEFYLRRRAEQGFTVIQAEAKGLNVPNAYGETPLKANGLLQPNEPYFEHVDWVVRTAEAFGLDVALLPTWGDKWNKKWGVVRRFSRRRMRRPMANGSAGAMRAGAVSGSSAATARSRTTGTAPSSRPWRAAYARATAGRT